MNLSEMVSRGIVLVFIGFVAFVVYTMVINSGNAQASYEYGVGIGEEFCDEHNGELEKVPNYAFRTTPNVEPSYIECKEVHDNQIEYNRYELVKGNYYLVVV